MRIKATLLMLLGLLAMSQAQLKFTLKFDGAAPEGRDVFVAAEMPKAPPTAMVAAGGASLEYTLPAFGSSDRIYVWDHKTNNIASKLIKDITASVWEVKPADYTVIGTLTVHVEHAGQPVQAANITLSGKGKSESRLLDQTGKGDVQFFGYPVGDLRVKVGYNTLDKKEGSQEQVFSEGASRTSAVPVLNVAIPDNVATLGPATPTTTTQPGAAQKAPPQGQAKSQPVPEESSNPIGKLIIMFIALVVVAGVIWWLFQMVQKKPDHVADTLKKLGVQIPNQQDPDAGAPTPVTPLAPAPPAPKIMLDDAEPIPLATGAAVVSAPVSVAAAEPTLVRETGERLTLSEGETVVGREDGLGLSLAGESTVSRRHATISRSGKTVVVNDLGSTNGTFVNGTRLQGETALKPGDQVQFGSVRFRYEG